VRKVSEPTKQITLQQQQPLKTP